MEVKRILLNYSVKDIRKATTKASDSDSFARLERLIVNEKEARSRCCAFVFHEGCRSRLCGRCCDDPDCSHDSEQPEPEPDVITVADEDSDSDFEDFEV